MAILMVLLASSDSGSNINFHLPSKNRQPFFRRLNLINYRLPPLIPLLPKIPPIALFSPRLSPPPDLLVYALSCADMSPTI